MLEFVVLCGSVRDGSMSRKACKMLVHEIERSGHTGNLCDLSKIKVEYFGAPLPQDVAQKVQQEIKNADGVFICTPEYDGSYSSALKGIIENLGYPSALNNKSVSLLGVASGNIGAVKALEHLRSVCSHIGSIVLPYPVSIAQIDAKIDSEGKWNDPTITSNINDLIQRHIKYLKEK